MFNSAGNEESKASGKPAWAHLVGKSADEAMSHIQAERPELKVLIVPKGSMVTADVRLDRVRLFVNDDGTVAKKPRIG